MLSFDMIQTSAIAVVVLLIGSLLVKRINLLEKYSIPAPVVGGTLFALIALVLRQTNVLVFEFDTTLQGVAMTAFFTSVGFSASISVLKKGGKKVILFLISAVTLVALQNVLGVSLATILGQEPLLGLATGSVPMTGGHGTAGAFGPEIEAAGIAGANTIALAAATFGLVAGGVLGGPTAKSLIQKYNLKSDDEISAQDSNDPGLGEAALTAENSIKAENFSVAAFQIIIAMGLGTIVTAIFTNLGITLPAYIGAMLIGAIMRNIGDFGKKMDVPMAEIGILGGIGLSLFLAMALMTLRLWELADLAVPMIVMLIGQIVLIALYARFVTFNLLGRDYTAAVLASGHCGFGLGATPNGVANMEAVTAKYGPAPAAFFVLPLVGALFIDFFNSAIIIFFMNML